MIELLAHRVIGEVLEKFRRIFQRLSASAASIVSQVMKNNLAAYLQGVNAAPS